MRTIQVDEGTYDLVMEMAKIMRASTEYILFRSVMREYVQGDEYHRDQFCICSGCGKPCGIVHDLDMSDCCQATIKRYRGDYESETD